MWFKFSLILLSLNHLSISGAAIHWDNGDNLEYFASLDDSFHELTEKNLFRNFNDKSVSEDITYCEDKDCIAVEQVICDTPTGIASLKSLLLIYIGVIAFHFFPFLFFCILIFKLYWSWVCKIPWNFCISEIHKFCLWIMWTNYSFFSIYRKMFGQEMLTIVLDIPSTCYITRTPTFAERYISSFSYFSMHVILLSNKYGRY